MKPWGISLLHDVEQHLKDGTILICEKAVIDHLDTNQPCHSWYTVETSGRSYLLHLAALTRAKELVVVIGPEKAIDTAVKEAEGDKRLSSLKDRIQVCDASHLMPACPSPHRSLENIHTIQLA